MKKGTLHKYRRELSNAKSSSPVINLLICPPKLDTGLAFFVYQNILRGGNLAYFLPKIPSYSYLRGQNTLLFSLVTINF